MEKNADIYPRSTACCTCMLTPACAERGALFYNPAVVRTLHPRRFERYCRFFRLSPLRNCTQDTVRCMRAREFQMRAIRCSNSICDFRWRDARNRSIVASNFFSLTPKCETLTKRRLKFFKQAIFDKTGWCCYLRCTIVFYFFHTRSYMYCVVRVLTAQCKTCN